MLKYKMNMYTHLRAQRKLVLINLVCSMSVFFFPVFDCNFESPCELEYSFTSEDQETSNHAWLRLSAEEISQLNILDGPERDHSENTPRGKMSTTM